MTTITRYSGKIIALAAAACAMGSTGYAEIVYDNSNPKSFGGSWFNAGTEFGDQVNLGGSARTITDFQISYYLSANATGSETAEVRLYSNADANSAPGTLLYDGTTSITYNASTGGYSTIDVSGLSIDVGSSVTWTILFNGISPIEQAGVLFYDPPTVGSSYDDYWVKGADGTWQLSQFPADGGKVANFGAQITAVPEPGTIALGIVGGLIWLGVAARRRIEAK